MSNRRSSDHYSRRARHAGFPARSVYKLEEIDRRFRLFHPGQRVVDLGCVPGSWMMYAATAVGPQGRVVGCDLQPLRVSLPKNCSFSRVDVRELDAADPALLRAADVVLSDMAPMTIGHRDTDHLRSAALVRTAHSLSDRLLRVGGALVAKLLDGRDFAALREELATSFGKVHVVRPRSTRRESSELFFVALSRRG
ncbi:MAG: RlmE family RNA methyltransferase [Pseudomonadota bacterium]